MVTQPKVHFNHQLNWSSALSKCVEICYALYLLKVINNGNATLKQITETFGQSLNVDLSDYAQSMKYIKNLSKSYKLRSSNNASSSSTRLSCS